MPRKKDESKKQFEPASTGQSPPVISVLGDVHTAYARVMPVHGQHKIGIRDGFDIGNVQTSYGCAVLTEAFLRSMALHTFPRHYMQGPADTLLWDALNPPAEDFIVQGPTLLQELKSRVLPYKTYAVTHLARTTLSTDHDRRRWRITPHIHYGVQERISKAKLINRKYNMIRSDCFVLDIRCYRFLASKADMAVIRRSLDKVTTCGIVVKFRDLLEINNKRNRQDIVSNLELLLKGTKNDSVLILNAEDLRERGVTISKHLSWERTLQDITVNLNEDILDPELFPFVSHFKHVVITFGLEGAISAKVRPLLREPQVERRRQNAATSKLTQSDSLLVDPHLIYSPCELEGDLKVLAPGDVMGYDSVIASAVARHLITSSNAGARFEGIEESIQNALIAARFMHLRGFSNVPQSPYVGVTYEGKEFVTASQPRTVASPPQMLPSLSNELLYYPTDIVAEICRSGTIGNVFGTPSEVEINDTWLRSHLAMFASIGDALNADAANRAVERADDDSLIVSLRKQIRDVTSLVEKDFRLANSVQIRDLSWLPPYCNNAARNHSVPVFQDLSWSLLSEALFEWPHEKKPLGDCKEAVKSFAKSILLDGFESAVSGTSRRFDRLISTPIHIIGQLKAIVREEIEVVRETSTLFQNYFENKTLKKPLSVAVFGKPGSGKSFAIREIIEDLSRYGAEPKFIEHNLSQFSSASELYGTFRGIQDVSLGGRIPVVFWDEYDCSIGGEQFYWLSKLLAPMDGSYSEGEASRPFGKTVFVFAGSRYRSAREFLGHIQSGASISGRKARSMNRLSPDEEKALHLHSSRGPDFARRIRAYMDVPGIDPITDKSLQSIKANGDGDDIRVANQRDPLEVLTYLIRRAMLARSALERLFGKDLIDNRQGLARIQEDVLDALLSDVNFRHGGGSLDQLVAASDVLHSHEYSSSVLPSDRLLEWFVDKVSTFEKSYHG